MAEEVSYTVQSILLMQAKATAGMKGTRKFLKRLRQMSPQRLDKMMGQLHAEEFEMINCLECAGCCRSISPAMSDTDVRRMTARLKMSNAVFTQRFLELDKEGDFVFRNAPCPFLEDDNFCSIYDARPRACREYPHTDRKRFYQILELTAKNSAVCPAVFNILEKLKKRV
jgi:uncharacterized protein